MPVKMTTRAVMIRTMLASTPRYLAMPPATPATMRSLDRVSCCAMRGSFRVFESVAGGEKTDDADHDERRGNGDLDDESLSLIHISEPTRLGMISYAVFC